MSLVEYNYPAHANIFMKIMVDIAELDILGGEFIYEFIFHFEDQEPLNPHFEFYNYQTMNLLLNSGSLFIILLILVLDHVLKKLIFYISLRCYRVAWIRRQGIQAS